MTKSIYLASSLALAFAVTLSGVAHGQAVPRDRSSEPSSGSVAPSSGSEGSQGQESSRSSDPQPVRSAEGRVAPREAPSSGSARPRSAPAPGGVIQGSRTAGASEPQIGATAGRDRVDGPSTRTAQPRGDSRGGDIPVSFPFYGPWGRVYPWYPTGFGWGFSSLAYDPWRYGGTEWMWGRNGIWYDPYGYYSYSPYVGAGSRWSDDDYRAPAPRSTEGAIRLRANPRNAKVYIDGALVGTVDDFDGLTSHLKLEAGAYQLELRAEGFQPYSGEMLVAAGKTLTERINLKRR